MLCVQYMWARFCSYLTRFGDPVIACIIHGPLGYKSVHLHHYQGVYSYTAITITVAIAITQNLEPFSINIALALSHFLSPLLSFPSLSYLSLFTLTVCWRHKTRAPSYYSLTIYKNILYLTIIPTITSGPYQIQHTCSLLVPLYHP